MAGLAACDPSRMDRLFELGHYLFQCADTGNFSGAAVDIFCYSPFAWGPPDTYPREHADEWWYGLPCPDFNDYETIRWN